MKYLNKLINKKFDFIKIKNLENEKFKEIDLINEVELEKIKLKNEIISLCVLTTYFFIKNTKKEDGYKLISDMFNEKIKNDFITSKAVIELKRMIKTSKSIFINLNNFNLFYDDLLVLSFMVKQNEIKESDIIELIKTVKNNYDIKTEDRKKQILDILTNIIKE